MVRLSLIVKSTVVGACAVILSACAGQNIDLAPLPEGSKPLTHSQVRALGNETFSCDFVGDAGLPPFKFAYTRDRIPEIEDADGYLAFSVIGASNQGIGIQTFGGAWIGEDNYIFSVGYSSSFYTGSGDAEFISGVNSHIFFLFTDPDNRKNTYVRYIFDENEEGLFKCSRRVRFESPLDDIISALRNS